MMSEAMAWRRPCDKPPHQTEIAQFNSLSELNPGIPRTVIIP